MPATRSRKRVVSLEADPPPNPTKKIRRTEGSAVKVEPEDKEKEQTTTSAKPIVNSKTKTTETGQTKEAANCFSSSEDKGEDVQATRAAAKPAAKRRTKLLASDSKPTNDTPDQKDAVKATRADVKYPDASIQENTVGSVKADADSSQITIQKSTAKPTKADAKPSDTATDKVTETNTRSSNTTSKKSAMKTTKAAPKSPNTSTTKTTAKSTKSDTKVTGSTTRKNTRPATTVDTTTTASTTNKSPAKAKDKKTAKSVCANAPSNQGVDSTSADETRIPGTAVALPELKPEKQGPQFAKAEHLVVPVDEQCPVKGYSVYVDDKTRIIYDASLNQTNASSNNNKFYRIQLIANGNESYRTLTRWGRVGENGKPDIYGHDGPNSFTSAISRFEKKFMDKSGLKWEDRTGSPKPGKYCFVERSYESENEDQNQEDVTKTSSPKSIVLPLSKLEPAVQSLVGFIFNQSHIDSVIADMKYDAAKLPLGTLSRTTITRGFQTLKDLSALFDNHTLASSKYDMIYKKAVEQLSNQFYSYIPHVFGRDTPPIIETPKVLKKEAKLLESLTDLKEVDAITRADRAAKMNIIDSRYQGLGMREMTPVQRQTEEFQFIEEYLYQTRAPSYAINFELLDIFRIERKGEQDRFRSLAQDKSSRKLLWHGSRSTNFGGILSQGLRIALPEAPVSGYMFGKGVYLADMSSKSASYCYSGLSNKQALLLLCEVELGNPIQELTNASYTAGDDAKAKGMLSTWGKGRTGPKAWKDAECIHPDLKGVMMPDTTSAPGPTQTARAILYYNEYVCYDVSQIRLRYLLRVRI